MAFVQQLYLIINFVKLIDLIKSINELKLEKITNRALTWFGVIDRHRSS